MSGSPWRHCPRHEEDISGQFRVTVPEAGELDQLRTWGGVCTKWALPEPFDPCKPPGEGVARGEVPSQTTGEWEEKPPEQGYPTPEQQLVEADKRRRKQLAALARTIL